MNCEVWKKLTQDLCSLTPVEVCTIWNGYSGATNLFLISLRMSDSLHENVIIVLNEVKAWRARCECPTLKKIFPKINKQGEVLEWEMSWVEILRKINNNPGGWYVHFNLIITGTQEYIKSKSRYFHLSLQVNN